MCAEGLRALHILYTAGVYEDATSNPSPLIPRFHSGQARRATVGLALCLEIGKSGKLWLLS
jgi:hypothetical protein